MFNNLCVYGRCVNIFGMFRCECDEGYALDGSGGMSTKFAYYHNLYH